MQFDSPSDVRVLQQQMAYMLQTISEFRDVFSNHQAALEEEQLRRRALRLAMALICGAFGRTQPQALQDARTVIEVLEAQFERNGMPEAATGELKALRNALMAEDAWPDLGAAA